MHQLIAYAAATGLRISPMEVPQETFEIENTKPYILFAASSGHESKNYAYFNNVLEEIKNTEWAKDFQTIQSGDSKDAKISVDIDLSGQTTLSQFAYLIREATVVVCLDSSALHIAGHFNKKIVALFGNTDKRICGAFFGDPSNQIYLESSHPLSKSFSQSLNTVNDIAPYRVTEAIEKLIKTL